MVLLGLSGMALFVVSVIALSVPRQFQKEFFMDTWEGFDDTQKTYVQDRLNCCGFDNEHSDLVGEGCKRGHPYCNTTELEKVRM